MNIDDNLIASTMQEQCDSALRILEQDNQNIKAVQKRLEEFMMNDELDSKAFEALKQQLSDYLTLSSGMMFANDLDIVDLHRLKEAVGEEELLGDAIQHYKTDALSDMNTYMNQASVYARKASGVPAMSPLHTWYQELALYYETRGILAERKYNQYQEMEQRFDEIEAATRNLFTRSENLRFVIRQGMTHVSDAFWNGVYYIDTEVSWRTSLVRERDRVVEGIRKGFLRTNNMGEQEYDWQRIAQWLEGDAETVPELEYLAFAELMSEMSESDLETLFANAQIMNRPGEQVYCHVSDVMQEAARQYLLLTELEAEFTLFDAHSSYQYDEVAVTNELSRATFIYQVVRLMDTGKYHSIYLSTTANDSGKLTYRADMTVKADVNMNLNDAEQWGRAMVSEMEKKTVVVNPWGVPKAAEWDLEDGVNVTLLSLNSSGREIFEKAGVDYATEYVFTKIGEGAMESIGKGLPNSFMLLELTRDMEEGYENAVAINGAIEKIEMRRAIDALGIHTGIMSITGTDRNSTELICPQYDSEELLVRVSAYNDTHEIPITVEELKSGFENGGQVFTDYMDWYSEDGAGDIKEYWGELDIIAKPYTESLTRMNVEQLQELINKYNDPSYEINAAVMGEEE
ncbi:MAG: hypothetical protein NC089_00765 [Bacteroides sp.]|nr:hypothetical protein [Bacteroides sp.]MCM1551055.1 hypothetical protein [Clostridium sp.]